MSKSKKTELEEKSDALLKRYGERRGIKNPDITHFTSTGKEKNQSVRDSKSVGDIWKEGEFWLQKLGKDTYSRSRTHPDVWKERAKIVDSLNTPSCECGKRIKNENEKVVFRSRGKCLDCLVKEETDAIAENREYVPRKITKKDMIIKDSMGNAIMSIAELEQELGRELSIEEINSFSKRVKKEKQEVNN